MKSKLLFLNISSGSAVYLSSIVIAFYITPIIVNNLGKYDYGLWEMLISIVGYMGLLDLGIGPALLRAIAMSYRKNNIDELQEIFGTALLFFYLLALLSLSFFSTLLLFPEIIIEFTKIEYKKFEIVLFLFAINIFIVLPLNVLVSTLFGFQCHNYVNYTRIFIGISSGFITYYLLEVCHLDGLIVLSCLQFVSNFISFCIFSYFLNQKNLFIASSIKKFSISKFYDLMSYGIKSSLFMLASRLQFATMPFIIGKSIGVNFIISYVLPNRLVDYARGFSLVIAFPLTPYFADLTANNDYEALKSEWLKSARVLQIFTVAAPFYLFFCGDVFLSLWIDNPSIFSEQNVIFALLFGFSFQAISPNSMQILLATSHHGALSCVYFFLSLISIPLSYYTSLEYGVFGAALSTSFVTSIVSLLALIKACIIMKSSLIEYFKLTLFPLLLPILLLALSLWLFKILLYPSNYFLLIFQVLFGSLIYAIAIWNFVLSRDDRKIIYSIVRNFK